MPTHEIMHSPGHPIPGELKTKLLKYFKESDLEKLERLGGRILISITAPYTDRKRASREIITIDDQFVTKIEGLKDSPDELRTSLNGLSVKQLKKLASLVGQPIRSNANAVEIRSELVKHLQAEDFWHRISGTTRKQ